MLQVVMNGVVNGVDVDRMGTTIQAIQQNTGLAAFRFRADNRWIDGGHNPGAGTAIAELYAYFSEMIERRRERPAHRGRPVRRAPPEPARSCRASRCCPCRLCRSRARCCLSRRARASP